MPRYFLNIYNDGDAPDEEGIEAETLGAAKSEAIRGARSLIADHVIEGRPITLSHRIEVADGRGQVLATIPFGDVVTIRP